MSNLVLNNIAALATLALLVYWQEREYRARVNRSRTGHTPARQQVIRWLLPGVGLVVILQLAGWLPSPTWTLGTFDQPLFYLGHIVFWLGLTLAVWSRQTLGKNWANAADFQIIPGQALVTAGPYRYIRHPIYVSLLLMLLGAELALHSSLILLILPFVWFIHWQAQ